MKCLKKLSAILLILSIALSSLYVFGEETVTVTLENSVALSNEGVYHIKTGDKYLFAVTGTSKSLAYEISVYDKEDFSLLTKVSGKHPSTVYLNVNNIHVKGDYLYSSYIQRSGNGNPFSAKYDIKEVYEGQTLSPELSVGMRPKAYSYMDNDILCRTDSGYGNITFMRLDNLDEFSAIGISSENADILKSYSELYVEGNLLYCVYEKNIYVYDVTDVLKGISRQDKQIYKGSFAPCTSSVTALCASGSYLYAGTNSGVYVIDMTNPSSPVNKGLISGTSYTKSIEINNGYMYVGRNSSLLIYSLSNAENPTLLHTVNTDSQVNEIHLREDKMYLGTNSGFFAYSVSGLEISDTTVAGSEALNGEISYSGKIEGAENIASITAGGNYLFALAGDKTKISVYDKASKEKVTEIYEENDGIKTTIQDLFVKGGYLCVSYDGIFRKYKLSELNTGNIIKEAVLPLYSDMTRDKANHISESDKYIFIAATNEADRDSLANSKIFIFDKNTREYLTSIYLDSGNANYDAAVRSMYVTDGRLYVSYNNAKTYASYLGSLATLVNGNVRYQSPLCVYDVSSVTKGQTLSPKVITSNSELTGISHPYNRGGASFLDEENSLLYQGIYTSQSSQSYKVYDVSTSLETLKLTLKNGSADSVKLVVSGDYLIEILQNNGGLYRAETTLAYNKIIVYNIKADNMTEIDLTERIIGSYQTSVYGDNVINDAKIYDGKIYIATTKGVDIIDLSSMKKTGTLLEDKAVYSLEIKNNMLFSSFSGGVSVFKNLSSAPEPADKYATSAVYAMSVNEEEGKLYITGGSKDGYGAILSYKNKSGFKTAENVPTLKNIDKTSEVLSPNGYAAKYSHWLTENDKYLFVVTSYETLYANSVVQIYDKETGELLSQISENTSNLYRYKHVRNIWLDGDVLYITWGHAWTKGDENCFTYGTEMSPTKVYNVENVTKDATISGLTLNTSGQRIAKFAPFMLGNNSYLDKENGKFYIATVANGNLDDYRTYYVYDTEEIKAAVKAGALSNLTVTNFTTGELSKNGVSFMVKDGVLYEILQSKAGFSEYNYSEIAETLVDNSGNALNNMVRVYDIGGKTPSNTKASYEDCLRGVYITETDGAKAIKDIEVYENTLYVATTSGIEVVSLAEVFKEGVTSNNYINLEAVKVIESESTVSDLELNGNTLYSASTGAEIYAKKTASSDGKITKFDLATPSQPEKTAEQSILYGACDISVNKEEKKIYVLNDVYDTPDMTAFVYDEYNKMISDEEETPDFIYKGSVILENIDSYFASMSDSKILIGSGESAAQINKISVYNASTKMKICDISKDAGALSEITVCGNYFLMYEGKALSIYNMPSSSCELSALLSGTYESTGDINSVTSDGKNVYLATTDGFVILNPSSPDGAKTIMAGKNITALSVSGDYLYGAEDSGKIFVYDTLTCSIDAENDTYESEKIINAMSIDETVFCLTEDGKISYYVTNDDVVINYDVEIAEPETKSITKVKEIKGFPNLAFSKRVFSNHTKVSANDKYVVTAGVSGISVFDSNMNLCGTISLSGISDIYLNDDELIVSGSFGVRSYNLKDSGYSVKTTFASNSSTAYLDGDKVWVYDKTAYSVTVYNESGENLFAVTDCPSGITKIYENNGYLILTSGKTANIYDVAACEDASAEEIFLSSLTTVQNITAAKAKDGYLYVSTYGGNAPSNRLYIYNLSQAGASETLVTCGNYSTSPSEQGGGKITDFEIAGDYIILDGCDDGELQIVNIKKKSDAYLESKLKKSKDDSYYFSDIAVNTNNIYAISESGGLSIYNYKCVDISDITFSKDEEGLNAAVKLYNESGKTVTGKLCLAVYDESGAKTLKNLTLAEITAENGKETIADTLKLDLSGIETPSVKAILYDDENLKPLCEYSVFVELGDSEDIVIYVDGTNTGGDGSKENPFASIIDAQKEVRRLNKQMSSDITVEIAGGRYEISEPLTFTEEDSGFNGYKVIWRAADGEKPVISGGRVISKWSLYDSENGIYSADAGGIKTRQLYVDGVPAVRARSEGGLTKAKTDGGSLGIYCYDEFLADYKNPKDLELVFIGSFLSKRIGVDGVYKLDSKGKTLIALNRPFWQYPNSFETYITPVYYENALELLDKENEFYLDMEEDVLYYKPYSEKNIEELEIVAPVCETLLSIEGEGLYKRAENIEFKGIEFTDTTWMGPTNDGGFYPTQAGHYIEPTFNSTTLNSNLTADAVAIKNADGISLSDCVFKNYGGNGIKVLTSKNVQIKNNVMRDVSAGGIYVGAIEKVHANPDDSRKVVENIVIDNNRLDNIGREYYTSCAIALGTVRDTDVTHNEISNTPYTAVHIGWGWNSLPKRNIVGVRVEYNYIHDVVQKLGDGGAIYTTGYTLADSKENPNTIANNHIGRVDGNGVFSGAAIYLDTGSSGWLISQNVIDLTESKSAWIPKWSSGNETNIFDSNYVTTVNGTSNATNTYVSETADWGETALSIIENAGLK